MKKQLVTALEAAGLSLENLRSEVAQKAQGVKKLITPTGDSKTISTCPNSIWVRDIIAPDSGETWSAIVSAADGKTYQINFTIGSGTAAGTVSLSGEPAEVISQVEYSPAPVEASSDDEDGQWKTINGRAVFIKEGESLDDALGRGSKTKDDDDDDKKVKAAGPYRKSETRHGVQFKIYHAGGDGKDAGEKARTASAQAEIRLKAQGFKTTRVQTDFDRKEGKSYITARDKNNREHHLEFNGDYDSKHPSHASDASPQKIIALEAFSVEAPTKFDAFMVMPAGVHTVSLSRMGKPHEVTVNVNRAGAIARQAQLEAVNRLATLKPFNCFNHEKGAASCRPLKYWWEDGSKAGRPAGIYESAEPTSAGLEAVDGKVYQGWSETFFVDNDFAGPENPAQIINPLDAYSDLDPNDFRNMGTLTNRPAFKKCAPLFAAQPISGLSPANAGASSGQKHKPNADNKMKKELTLAELQARNEQLETSITELQGKHDAVSQAQLSAAQSELETVQTRMELARTKEKNAALEASETQRKEEAATAAVQTMIGNGLIPMLNKEMQASYHKKFVADPTLIPLLAGVKTSIANGRTTAGSSVAVLGYGDVREGANRILKALEACLKQQRPIVGLDAESNQRRTVIARDMALIYAKEIRGGLDAEGRPTIKDDYLLAPMEAAVDSDTLGTLVGTLVAQRTLDLFTYNLPLIDRIMTDFSDLPSDLNQTVKTRKVLIPTVQSYDNTLGADGRPNGWGTASAGQTTDIDITLDELVGVPIPFSLATLSSTQRALFMETAPAASYAMAKYFIAKLYAVCTAANFNSYAAVTAADAQGVIKVPNAYATYAVGEIDFAKSHIAKIGAAFDANEVPEQDRTLLLNAGYYAKAIVDPSLVSFFAGQNNPEIVTEGRLPMLAGFAPVKAANFPGTNNRVGMALQKNGLLAKSRLPANLNEILPGAGNGSVTQIVHPKTGMAMMLIQYTNHQRGFTEWLPCVILGAAKGDARGGLVITNQ